MAGAFALSIRARWLDARFLARRGFLWIRSVGHRALRSYISILERLAAVAMLCGLGWFIGGPWIAGLVLAAGTVAIAANGTARHADDELGRMADDGGGREP